MSDTQEAHDEGTLMAKRIGYFLADLIWWEGQLQIKLGCWWRRMAK